MRRLTQYHKAKLYLRTGGPVPTEIETQAVNFTINDVPISGYAAYPIKTGPYPPLIVIQEWWGLDAHIQDITERLARVGFAVFAPDLYHGTVTSEPDEALKLAMSLEYDRAATEIDAAGAWLCRQKYASSTHFGIVGYCMGGGLALTTAIRNPAVQACAVYYGALPKPRELLQGISAPVLAFYGSD